MNFENYQAHIKKLCIGKNLPQAIYIHKSALLEASEQLAGFSFKLANILNLKDSDWDLVKFHKKDFKLAFLCYPTFFDTPYPALHKSITIDLLTKKTTQSNYKNSANPPILHRRETFISPSHELIEQFRKFTKEGEEIGLYKNTRIIGFRENWLRLIKQKGYYLDDKYNLQPLTDQPQKLPTIEGDQEIQRHKTAISRDRLSRPMYLLQQRGFLDGNYTLLDYGCGRGDDLAELMMNDIECHGWDPVHKPDGDLKAADIVNLGFVINVIEDRSERDEALIKASKYANKILIVSAMIGNEKIYEKFRPFKDGVITEHNTFQKYFTQGEMKQYIASTLNKTAIALSSGIYAVFYDELEEQEFLLKRQKRRSDWRSNKRNIRSVSDEQAKAIFSKYPELFEDFWMTCIDLGRAPLNAEFEQSEQLRYACGSHNKAFEICKKLFDQEILKKASTERKEDLRVYFALSHFNKRPNYSRMPKSLQLDIKQHFGSISDALENGKKLLFSLSDTSVIEKSCIKANESLPASELTEGHNLIFHKSFLSDCPAELRAYIGCAIQLYGDIDDVSLIKAHIQSGKVTFLIYDDFDQDVPLLRERIKIKLREQDIDFFDYIHEFQPQPLVNKKLFTI